MSDMHLAALELSLTAENWSAKRHRAFGDRRARRQRGREALSQIQQQAPGVAGRRSHGRGRRVSAGAHLPVAIFMSRRRRERGRSSTDNFARTRAGSSTNRDTSARNSRSTSGKARRLVLEKLASFYTSRDQAISECGLAARKAIARAGRFEALLAEHVLAWKHLWRRFDVHLQPAGPGFKLNVPMLLRLNMFHLLQAVSPNSIGLDIGVPARGWTGEAYQGHIFWDELFIFPFLNYRMPEITRSLLMYRYRRLGEARAAATKRGVSGRHVPMAKRQRRTGGNAGAQPQPALATLGA